MINVGYNWLWVDGRTELAGIAAVAISAILVFVCELPSSYEITGRNAGASRLVRFGMLTGTLTYGIYLWHYMLIRSWSPVFDVIVRKMGVTETWLRIMTFHVMQITFAVAASYSIAFVTFHLIETKFRPGLYGSGQTAKR